MYALIKQEMNAFDTNSVLGCLFEQFFGSSILRSTTGA